MQATREHSSDHEHDFTSESEAKLSQDRKSSLTLNEESCSPNAFSEQHDCSYNHHHRDEDDDVYVDANEHDHEHEHEDENDDDDEEEEFSFIFDGANTSPIAAEDAFMNGQIKASFPHFKVEDDEEGLPIKPQVKNVFLQFNKDNDNNQRSSEVTSASPDNDEISGPYCEWSKKAASPSSSEACKKSNSTGFSKLWRFKEFRNRSNSDGRDAFVYLNNNQSNTTSLKGNHGEVKVNDGKGKVVKKGVVKSKTASLSPHEIYLINKAKEDDRRRSYLPYRQDMVGFFTNVNGGMSKNVHPF